MIAPEPKMGACRSWRGVAMTVFGRGSAREEWVELVHFVSGLVVFVAGDVDAGAVAAGGGVGGVGCAGGYTSDLACR